MLNLLVNHVTSRLQKVNTPPVRTLQICILSIHLFIYMWAGQFGIRMSMGGRFSPPVLTGPGAHPASCTVGTGSLKRIEQPMCGLYLSPSSAIVKEMLEPFPYSKSVPSLACHRVKFQLFEFLFDYNKKP